MPDAIYTYIGAIPPGGNVPGFATPLYRCGDALFLHETDSFERIGHFEGLADGAVEGFDLVDVPGEPVPAHIGDPAKYVYLLPGRHSIAGPGPVVRSALAKKLGTLRAYPFSRLDAAAFIGNKRGIVQAAVDSDHRFRALNVQAATSWKEYIWDKFSVTDAELTAETLSQFSIALIALYRKFHGLLGAANRGTREKLERQYAQRYVRIFEFLIDSHLEDLLNQELSSTEMPGEQLLLDLDERARQHMHGVLTRAGSRGNAASKFVDCAQRASELARGDGLKQGEPLRFGHDLAGFHDGLLRELGLARLLDRAEKKLRKRDIDISTISITYGLVMVIKAHSMSDTLPGSLYRQMKLYGALTIDHGLRNLRPPRSAAEVGEEFVRAVYGS